MLNLLDDNGNLPLRSAAGYDNLDPHELRMFCHHAARYCLPTTELVGYLRSLIGTDHAIEIGAGCGDLGRALGIRMTDNYCQTWPGIKTLYGLTQQPTIEYGRDVERLDALDAIEQYKPDIVIGAWVTQWIDPKLPPPPGGGSIYGIKEEEILRRVKRYVVVGAEAIHKYKQIMKYPHEAIPAPFARSRRNDNMIWIWNGI